MPPYHVSYLCFMLISDGVFLLRSMPDRQWSSVDEIRLPESAPNSGVYELTGQEGAQFGPASPEWSFGPRQHHERSFYCTHLSAAQRLRNGNTLSELNHFFRRLSCLLLYLFKLTVTLGPNGIVIEVTADGQEVWRYISPVLYDENAVSMVRQGHVRHAMAKTSIFR
jgi:hypothetical protein